jgi:hypothetical protein
VLTPVYGGSTTTNSRADCDTTYKSVGYGLIGLVT